MPFDLVLRDARIAGPDAPIDVGIAGGRIVEIAPGIAAGACERSLDGRLAFPTRSRAITSWSAAASAPTPRSAATSTVM
jgi:hypothetical protein